MAGSLTDFIFANETAVRMSAFLGVLAVMAGWEVLAPRRYRDHGRTTRWPGNLSLVVISAVLVRLIFPVTAVGLAIYTVSNGFGLFHWLGVPYWAAVLLTVAALDLTIYVQHVVFHRVPALWRLHRMHHADLDFDVTTGIRFHPVEIVMSMAIKLAMVAALGAPALGVVLFEILLNASAMFNHSNVRLPLGLDRVLRLVVVTPDMHRVHHSVIPRETHANFGFFLPWWDRLFATYRAQPEAGHDGMTIGLPQFRDPAELRLDRLLTQPWRDDPRSQFERKQA